MKRPGVDERLTPRDALLGVLRVLGALVGSFLLTGLFTIVLMLAGVRR